MSANPEVVQKLRRRISEIRQEERQRLELRRKRRAWRVLAGRERMERANFECQPDPEEDFTQ